MPATSPQSLRLRRLDNLFVKTPLYFLTLCTHQRTSLLANEKVHLAFKGFTERARDHGVFVGRYVLMPDHAHFFAAIAESGPSLSVWIKSLKNSLSKIFREQGIPAPHWQKSFFDHVMRSADSYSGKWEYVRANPLRAGLVTAQDDWPFQGTINDLKF